MQFAVLGPLQVVTGDGDEPVVVSAARLRVLLAALLWRVNQPVPVDELAEMVWEGAPPARPAAATRALVLRLRRVLGERGGARIVTRAPGYMIELSEAELDASRFETLSRDASAAVRARQWAVAGQAAASALGLWRGTPLADVSSQLLRDQWVPHLEQARVQVLEWRIQADLEEGRHEQLIGELREVIVRYPLREHFHAQLMLALARAGRQAEALAAYQEARGALVSELGIEPGLELRQVHERVLAGDTPPVTPPSVPDEAEAPSTGVAVPRQLPATARSFVGRQAELDILYSLVNPGQDAAGGAVVISAIDGMAGVGKTALAVHAAHRLTTDFPDGQLYIDLHGYTQASEPRSAGEALEAILRALGVSPKQIPDHVEERAALFRQRLAGTRTLILLDNAVSEAQVRPLLPGAAGCLVLITSRRRLKGLDEAHVLALDVLPQADALALMRAVVGSERPDADDLVLSEIIELCERLPLALRIAAALLRHRPAWPVGHLAGLLRDQRHRIRTLSDGERHLGPVLDLSYDGLSGPQQLLFRRLGLVPGRDIDAYAAAALTAASPFDAGVLLEDLVDHNLLIQHLPGRYRLHDLIRLHARALVDQDPAHDRDAALARLLDYYQQTARQADALIERAPRSVPAGPGPAHAPALPDADAARSWLRAERPNLLAAVRYSISHGDRKRTIALTAGLNTVLRADGPWIEAIDLHAAATTAATSLGDRPGQANALIRLGDARALTGDFAGAAGDLQQALQLFGELGGQAGQAEALTRLGAVKRLTGDCQGAASVLEQALELFRELGDQAGQAKALTRLADVKRLTGDYRGAAHDLEQALQLFRELGEQAGEPHALIGLAAVKRLTGDYRGAAHDLEQALQLFRELGEQAGEPRALIGLGDMKRLSGDYAGAVHSLERALQLFRQLGEQVGQASALGLLGQVRLSLGDFPGAARDLKEAIDLSRRIGARGNEAWAMNHYAAVFIGSGDFTRARALYQGALRLARQTCQLDDEALALEGIGECYLRTADTQSGIAYLKQALDIFRRLAINPDANRVDTRLTELSAATSPATFGISW
jgi:DNA-binding SARP family transcriptional activator/tetratricopeptide (TPR) repeat protein